VRLGGKDRLDVAGGFVQAADQVQHLAGLGDGEADVAQVVGELLEFAAVVGDGEVALNNIAELRLKKDGTLQLVIAKKYLNGRPDGEGVGVRLVDEVEDRLVDGCVESIDKTAVDLPPLSVAVDDERRSADMTDEAELPKNRV
jgi:hypothetical protein